jgi:tRNA (Thr-GGU) A37 N-methylase
VLAVEGGSISIADVDVLDGTPLLDIKPYVPAFDAFPGIRCGWYEKAAVNCTLADGRFAGA